VLRRLFCLVVAGPAAIALVALAVINRHDVRLILDPFRPDDPVLSLVLPFYAYLLAMLIIGVIIGGATVWMTQRRWRRAARRRTADAVRWQAEADRLTQERDRRLGSVAELAPGGR
jgi:hypothetical protein